MAEYIKREALLDSICYETCGIAFCGATNCAFMANVCSAPVADVAPVVHARWIHSRYEDCSEQFELVKCSQCNHEAYAMAFYVRGGNYCPVCGAKMDGVDNDAVG